MRGTTTMKPRELQPQIAARLRAAGIPEASLEAELLLRHPLGLDRVGLHLDDRELDRRTLDAIEGLVSRRLGREPLSYILGEKEFWSLPFAVSPAVLIPRPETELLIEEVLRRVPETATFAGEICDLGSGSGVIPVVLARELPRARLVGIDISPAALAVATANGRRHGVEARLTWLEGDWFAPLPAGSRFDFVVGNPPYVAENTRDRLQPELAHEPPRALFGGPDGLAAIRRILPGSLQFLKPGGFLLLEIGGDQEEAVYEECRSLPAFEEPAIVKDYAGLPRLLVVMKKKGE